jgi:hypothetical protein
VRGSTVETHETGELLVLAELNRQKIPASRAPGGERGIHLVTSMGSTLNVKAKRGSGKGRWLLGQEGRRPQADLVVLVSVGSDDASHEFFVLPVGDLYDWAEDRHRAYWATRPDAVTGERNLVGIRDSAAEVSEFLEPYRDAWGRVRRER